MAGGKIFSSEQLVMEGMFEKLAGIVFGVIESVFCVVVLVVLVVWVGMTSGSFRSGIPSVTVDVFVDFLPVMGGERWLEISPPRPRSKILHLGTKISSPSPSNRRPT